MAHSHSLHSFSFKVLWMQFDKQFACIANVCRINTWKKKDLLLIYSRQFCMRLANTALPRIILLHEFVIISHQLVVRYLFIKLGFCIQMALCIHTYPIPMTSPVAWLWYEKSTKVICLFFAHHKTDFDSVNV